MSDGVVITLPELTTKHLLYVYGVWHLMYSISFYYTTLYKAKQRVKQGAVLDRKEMAGFAICSLILPILRIAYWTIGIIQFPITHIAGRTVSLIMFGEWRPFWTYERWGSPAAEDWAKDATKFAASGATFVNADKNAENEKTIPRRERDYSNEPTCAVCGTWSSEDYCLECDEAFARCRKCEKVFDSSGQWHEKYSSLKVEKEFTCICCSLEQKEKRRNRKEWGKLCNKHNVRHSYSQLCPLCEEETENSPREVKNPFPITAQQILDTLKTKTADWCGCRGCQLLRDHTKYADCDIPPKHIRNCLNLHVQERQKGYLYRRQRFALQGLLVPFYKKPGIKVREAKRRAYKRMIWLSGEYGWKWEKICPVVVKNER